MGAADVAFNTQHHSRVEHTLNRVRHAFAQMVIAWMRNIGKLTRYTESMANAIVSTILIRCGYRPGRLRNIAINGARSDPYILDLYILDLYTGR